MKAKALATQNSAAKSRKKFAEVEKKLVKENKEYQLKIKELELGNELLKSNNETIATQLAIEQKKSVCNKQKQPLLNRND